MLKIRWILILWIVAVAVFIGIFLFHKNVQNRQQEAYTDLQQRVTLEETEQAEYTLREGDAPVALDGVTKESQEIDFAQLQNTNPELIAWIRIPDTVIDYPVARHEGTDQSYYLHHNMYGETAFSGCIYMECVNAGDFSDYNTVLYGHNMKNGSMFAALHKYEDRTFLQQHPYIYIYLPGHCYRYEIFAAYTADDTNLNAAFNFQDAESYASYVKNLEQNRSMDAVWRDDVEVTADVKMITLSTCVGGQPGRRYLVQGIKTGDTEGNESNETVSDGR